MGCGFPVECDLLCRILKVTFQQSRLSKAKHYFVHFMHIGLFGNTDTTS